MTRPVIIRFDGRPALLNAERSGHWSEHRALTEALRGEAALRARNARARGLLDPIPEQVAVRSWPTYRTRRSWPDVAAWAPATKAVLDGFVDAGVLPNDTPAVVRRSTFETPRVDAVDQLVVALIPWNWFNPDLGDDDPLLIGATIVVPDAGARVARGA